MTTSVKVKSIGRAYTRQMDFSRMRRNFQGKPRNYVSFGVVGHIDQNPAFARVEHGRVLVEVTLVPSGDEIVAQLQDPGGGDGFAMYMPVRIGMRVVVGMPQGDGDLPVILGKVDDETWPFPEDVAGIDAIGDATDTAKAAPQFAFVRTPEGAHIAVESGDGADVLIHSGASLRLATSPTGQVVVRSPETHLGADFSSDPEPPLTGPSGEVTSGAPAEAFVPTAGSNLIGQSPAPTVNPITGQPYPADGIVRFKDGVQANTDSDSYFFNWIATLHSSIAAWVPVPNDGGAALKTALATWLSLAPPQVVEAFQKSSSRSTAAD